MPPIRPETRITIVAGAGAAYGSGHLVRMTELTTRLCELGARANLLTIADAAPERVLFAAAAPDLWVLDARDADPGPFAGSAPVIALDNRCADRAIYASHGEITFHDTLPHPAADLDACLENALISRDLRPFEDIIPLERRIFCYSGAFSSVAPIDELLVKTLQSSGAEECLRCGLQAPEERVRTAAGFRHVEALERRAYIEEIAQSGVFISYFGMSMLEAWRLGKVVVLADFGSAVHRELMEFLARETGLLAASFDDAEQMARLGAALMRGAARPPEKRPGARGYDRLIALISDRVGA